jgi:hypothetical protein
MDAGAAEAAAWLHRTEELGPVATGDMAQMPCSTWPGVSELPELLVQDGLLNCAR